MCIIVPPATPEQYYYSRTAHGYVSGNDLRLFPRLMDPALDERAVFALFQYGSVPPPLSLYRGVQRVANGHELTLTARGSCRQVAGRFILGEHKSAVARDAETAVQEALDAILVRAPQASVLYFSGGVDSTLMAARLVEHGRRDLRLVNYSFGPEDEESRLAVRIAAHLGLECRQVQHDSRLTSGMLDRIARDYTFPFGDFSTLPTNILVHESIPFLEQSATVIEGTGADGAFGVGTLYPPWRRIYQLPVFLRWPAAAAYRRFGSWKRDSYIERLGRVARKSVQMPLMQAFVAQNALRDIAYEAPGTTWTELEDAVATDLESLTSAAPPEERLSLLDLMWVCAGRMAPKSFDPLRAQNAFAIYPFLEPDIIELSSSLSWTEKCAAGQEKALLKKLLVRHIPHEWAYRAKSGFTPPYREVFASMPLQTYLHDIVLSTNNPVLAFCRADRIREMVALTEGGSGLSATAYDFLWTLTFTSCWLNQLPECAKVADWATVRHCPSLA